MCRLLTVLGVAALIAGWAGPAAGQAFFAPLAVSPPREALRFEVDAEQAAVLLRFDRFRLRLHAQDYLKLPVDEPFDGLQLDGETPLALDLFRRDAEIDEEHVLLTFVIGW